jgi:hypothetical protein
MSDADDKKSRQDAKKERVLHTRVPAVLEQELKRVANAWRVPVSNVVRALLEDALDTIDVVGAKAVIDFAESRASSCARFPVPQTEQRQRVVQSQPTSWRRVRIRSMAPSGSCR